MYRPLSPARRARYPNWEEPARLRQIRGELKYTDPRVVDHIIRLAPKSRRRVVQAGAHLGIWPAKLATKFQRVSAFEPIFENYEVCLDAVKADNVRVYCAALS